MKTCGEPNWIRILAYPKGIAKTGCECGERRLRFKLREGKKGKGCLLCWGSYGRELWHPRIVEMQGFFPLALLRVRGKWIQVGFKSL
jgi:hypothetical protein